jgi:hypothetical protein
VKGLALALTIPAAALALAAPAAAYDDADFIDVLNSGSVHYTSAGDAVRQAHVVCQLFDERDTFVTVRKALQDTNYSFSFDDASYFIGAAVSVYCPYNKPWVHSTLG